MKHHKTTSSIMILAAALTAAACSHEPALPTPSARDQLLDRAFALVKSDPAQASRLFEEAGPGAILENARMASWADCLERTSATSQEWWRYVAASPPPDLASEGRLRLVEALLAEGNDRAAETERAALDENSGPAADEMLLSAGLPEVRLAAAQRLVVTSPRRLSSHDGDLDRRLQDALDPAERIQRSRAWRRDNVPSRAAAELRGQRWSGEEEIERRRELARAELDAGSPQRALRTIPDGRNTGSADLALRALAYRSRAWDLWPDRSSKKAFASCRAAAEGALALGPNREERNQALVLRLECATETGALEAAFESWKELEAGGWANDRRAWLGRRLGVALAINGSDSDQVLDIADALPSDARCLNFWIAASADSESTDLAALTAVPVPDLYASWALDILARGAAAGRPAPPPIAPAQPPASVQRLLGAGAEEEAAREWRRIRGQRQPSPEEALAGAQLAGRLGQANDSIRWLRTGFPELGTVFMTEAPANAVEAYLPLRWRSALTAAAAEFGLDPWLLAGIARQESTFTAHAVSPRGAVGTMQLLPSTARSHARALGLTSTPNLRNAELNLRLGARELAQLLQRFGAVEPALAAYNGGVTRVRAWWKRQPDRRRFTEEIPIPETYTYVRRVIYLREAYRQVYENSGRTPQ